MNIGIDIFSKLVGKGLNSSELPPQTDDELVFKRALIYDNLSSGDDRLQVKIIPDFKASSPEEEANFPKYPPFIKGNVIKGKSIKADGLDNADSVWVICSKDLKIGYVIGLCNEFGDTKKSYKKFSYSFKNVKNFLTKRGLYPEEFNFENMVVSTWFSTSKGGLVIAYNRINGDYFVINSSGTTLSVCQDKMYFRVGSPSKTGLKTAFTAVTATPGKLHVKCDKLELEAEDITVGAHNWHLAAIPGEVPVVGKNGVSAVPISNTHA